MWSRHSKPGALSELPPLSLSLSPPPSLVFTMVAAKWTKLAPRPHYRVLVLLGFRCVVSFRSQPPRLFLLRGEEARQSCILGRPIVDEPIFYGSTINWPVINGPITKGLIFDVQITNGPITIGRSAHCVEAHDRSRVFWETDRGRKKQRGFECNALRFLAERNFWEQAFSHFYLFIVFEEEKKQTTSFFCDIVVIDNPC